MKMLISFTLICTSIFCTQCKKNDNLIEVTPSVSVIDTTEARITMNNQLCNYMPDIVAYPYSTWVNYEFKQVSGIFNNRVIFSGFPLKNTGSFGNEFTFVQSFGYDQNNHKYTQIDKETAFLKVTEFNADTKKVSGNFKATFVRTSTGQQSTDSYLPDTLSFSGSFHSTYRDF